MIAALESVNVGATEAGNCSVPGKNLLRNTAGLPTFFRLSVLYRPPENYGEQGAEISFIIFFIKAVLLVCLFFTIVLQFGQLVLTTNLEVDSTLYWKPAPGDGTADHCLSSRTLPDNLAVPSSA